MLQKLKRKWNPTDILMILGFAISFTSVLIGISSIDALITELSPMDSGTPIYVTMENTGLSLILAIYIFSIANCLIVTNYWILNKRKDMAIRKAFGWTNRHLICMIVSEMAGALAISFGICIVTLAVLRVGDSNMFSVELTPGFILGTCVVLLFTLFVAVLIPVIRTLKIRPAEVIS